MKLYLLIPFIVAYFGLIANAHGESNAPDSTKSADTTKVSKFDSFNAKAEHLFKIIPVPIFSYSSDAGNIFGLAKFNVFQLSKKDTVSRPSKISGVFTVSSKGRINFSLSDELVFKQNKWVVLSYINYKKTPEYIFGIGNDVKIDDVESITVDRIKFVATALYGIGKNFYFGGGLDLADYFKVETDSNSFIVEQNVNGQDGGTNVGLGLGGAFDKRDNRYNPSTGAYVIGTWLYYGKSFGSTFEYSKIELDARKYFNHYKKHVIAIQATTTYATTAVPFYELSMMGGEYQMRGYYKGALRDQVLVDGQIEYRMPVWKIFGLTSWIATGRVASSYHSLNMDGLWLSYGGGFRVKVDSKSNVNLRVDFGFGPDGISGVYLNFAEAF